MPTVTVTNTDANLSAKTIVVAENAQTITGLHTFDRDPNAPFAVSSGSAKVDNLNADKIDGVDVSGLASSGIVYASSATELGNSSSFTFDGTTVTIPGQITFPSAQSASAGANTLDDYEEGTWTPVLGGSGGTSGQTYDGATNGTYVKIGKQVTAVFRIVLTAKGTITTNAQVQGLPFTIENSASYLPPLVISYWNNLNANKVFVGGFGVPNTTAATIYGIGAAAAGLTVFATADIANTTELIGVITYRATA